VTSENSNPHECVDIEIDVEPCQDPYKNKIAKGHDAEFLRLLCDSLDVGVSILDENLRYSFIGNAVYKNLKLSTDDLQIGDPLARCHDLMLANGMLTPEMLKKNKLSVEEQVERAKANEKQTPSIVKLGNGSTHKFIRKTLPNGYTVSMAQDVTELVEKDRILEVALAQGRAGYWTYDFATKKYYLSNSLQNYLPKEKWAKIPTQGIITVIHPDDQHNFRLALRNAKTNKDKFAVTCRIIAKNGDIGWVQTNGLIIRDHDGKPKKIRAFVKDITRERRQAKELERAKDEAVAASHAKSEFLANMSHEIRTPMNGILGMAELLANSEINERQRDFVNIINSSASALLSIINDILDFSKIEAGAFEIDPMPFDLKSSINDVTALLTSHAQEKELELIINYPSDMRTHLIGDGGRLRQVVTNLVDNAIKFTETGHVLIDINVSEARDNMAIVTISVTDTGIGIEPEKLSKVFTKFTQADGSTTRIYGGTGLGLSISKAIVELMGGRMTARSVLGEGSTFTARIPLQIDPEAITESYDTSTLYGKRALIVDDISVNRSILTEQLASWGVKSDSVKDGVEALTQLKNTSTSGELYDFILLDFFMPGLDGQELAKMIFERADFAHTPIIMLSSCDQPVSSQELKKIGINSYLVKPVRETRLYEAITRVLTPETHTTDADINLPNPESENKSTKTEILVAEDFQLNKDVVSLMLADTHYRPIFADNGLEAVQMYKAEPDRFPVILMDVSMPVMDGQEATKLIQKFEKENGITPKPIIALTGHALKNDREECLNSGMCDYLTKPVKQTDLLEKLDLWRHGAAAAKILKTA